MKSTVFIGGSRHVSRLPAEARTRVDNIASSGHRVVVGDANGADKAVQQHLLDAAYKNVTVFCSGKSCRNNLGEWPTHHVDVPKALKGFQFYAAKDREMAREADFGLMIWDAKSAGTILNVLRLVRLNKKAVLVNANDKHTTSFKTSADWDEFLSSASAERRSDLRERATEEEWSPVRQTSLLDGRAPSTLERRNLVPKTADDLTSDINAAFAAGDLASVVEALGSIAKVRGMTHVANDTGLARESLYRSLNSGGNPELATILKVMASVGLRLTASRTSHEEGVSDASNQ